MWTNLAISVLATLIYGFGVRIMFGKRKFEFGLSSSILEVIYLQALIWYDSIQYLNIDIRRAGTIFAPATIMLALFSTVILFKVKKFVLIRCGLPPKRIYNSYTQNIYFQFFLLFTLGLMLLPVGWVFTRFVIFMLGQVLDV